MESEKDCPDWPIVHLTVFYTIIMDDNRPMARTTSKISAQLVLDPVGHIPDGAGAFRGVNLV
jgi:hypothetical protein